MTSAEEARDAIQRAVDVSRADVVAAKNYLFNLVTPHRIEIHAQSREWANIVAPDAPRPLPLYLDDLSGTIRVIARYISARLAFCVAAWEMVRSGQMLQVGTIASENPEWGHTTVRPGSGGHSGGISWPDLVMIYPEGIQRPAWFGRQTSVLFESDLYLQRLAPSRLHRQVETALRMALDCFQRELYIPCVAMLGAASEGAWIEAGLALAAHSAGQPDAERLRGTLIDHKPSTKAKIAAICSYYERPDCKPLHEAAGVNRTRAREIQQWSDQIREARNVLHWGSVPSVPNNYEKTAILLMDAVTELTDLHAIRNACESAAER